MSTYKVGLSAGKHIVHVALGAALLPAGFTQIGTYVHDEVADPMGNTDEVHTHVHHVQEVLGRTSWDTPGTPALFPYNITDLSRIKIYLGWQSAPQVATAPAITGTSKVGQTLTVSAGTWTGVPTLTRQWKANGVAIAGATGLTYVPVTGDIGKLITVDTTATQTSPTGDKVNTVTSAPTVAVVA